MQSLNIKYGQTKLIFKVICGGAVKSNIENKAILSKMKACTTIFLSLKMRIDVNSKELQLSKELGELKHSEIVLCRSVWLPFILSSSLQQ